MSENHAEPKSIPSDEAREHLLYLLRSGFTRRHLSKLTGVPAGVLASLLAVDKDGHPRVATVAPGVSRSILLVRPDVAALAPDTWVLAQGARRRVQALLAMGWPVKTVAVWLHVGEEALRGLIEPSTRAVTARAHQAVDKVFRACWAEVPTAKDAESLRFARQGGWRTALAWDDIDFDLQPADRKLRAVRAGARETVDEVAVTLALEGERVVLRHVDECGVVRRAHARKLTDDDIAQLTGIPAPTVFHIRAELGLAPNCAEDGWTVAVSA